ncbi:MAG: Phytophthora parasitica virus [Bacteroidota bacterium]|jgi:hypothetical protein
MGFMKYTIPFLKNSVNFSFFNLPATTHMSNGYQNRFASFTTEDRQWDARFNVQTEEDLTNLIEAAKREWNTGKLKYILIGGVEVGTKEYQDDFGIKHVHCALLYNNRVSKRSILKNLAIKQGNGYYLVPRNRSLPYTGWRNHHTKEFSKVKPEELLLLEMGTLPADRDTDDQKKFVKRSDEEKKRKIDEVLIDMRGMLEKGDDEQAFKKYPRSFIQYGEKLKALIHQKSDQLKSDGHPHIWLYGTPGSGKSAVLSFIYPNTYKKNLYNKFFDLYDAKIHDHIMLEDLDHDAVDKLSTNFIKTLCDESGFPIDQKYKTPQLARSTILVTSNFTISEVIMQSDEANMWGKSGNVSAILRRFWHINVKDFLRIIGVKLLPKYEIQMLKKQGNTDPSKLFMVYDYNLDIPTGEPLKTPEDYQQLIKDSYYK